MRRHGIRPSRIDGWAVARATRPTLATQPSPQGNSGTVLARTPAGPGDELQAQIRHRSTATSATVTSIAGDRLELVFADAVSAISPGQSLVLYRGSQVVGGGIIDRAPRALPVAAA